MYATLKEYIQAQARTQHTTIANEMLAHFNDDDLLIFETLYAAHKDKNPLPFAGKKLHYDPHQDPLMCLLMFTCQALGAQISMEFLQTHPAPVHADHTETPEPICHALLVEDNPLSLKIGKFNLMQWGYTVSTAANGAEAEAYLNKTRFDIIYLDLGLPDKSGLLIAAALRNNAQSPNQHTPMIALTAHVDDQAKSACQEAGFTHMLSKPLTEADARRLKTQILAQATELPVIDWNLWYKRCQNHEPLIHEALKTVLRDLPLFEQQIRDALADNNIHAIRDTLHTCLGMLRFCALPRLEQSVETLHHIARKQPDQIILAFENFQIQSRAALTAIQAIRTDS